MEGGGSLTLSTEGVRLLLCAKRGMPVDVGDLGVTLECEAAAAALAASEPEAGDDNPGDVFGRGSSFAAPFRRSARDGEKLECLRLLSFGLARLSFPIPKSSSASSSHDKDDRESLREKTAGVPSTPEKTRGDSEVAVSKGE